MSRMEPGDKGLVISFNNGVRSSVEFTDDVDRMVSFVEGLQAWGGTSLNDAIHHGLNRVRDACNGFLGSVGESAVTKHYQKARADLEKGAGAEAIDEAIQHIAKAAAILKGPPASEALLLQLKSVK